MLDILKPRQTTSSSYLLCCGGGFAASAQARFYDALVVCRQFDAQAPWAASVSPACPANFAGTGVASGRSSGADGGPAPALDAA